MIVSALVFERSGYLAKKFFETEHTAFYRLNDEILTVTSYENRVSPLGIAGAPLKKPNWIMIEKNKLIFENTEVSKKFVMIYDPFVGDINYEKIRNNGNINFYLKLLEESSGKTFEKILSLIHNGNIEKIVGLGTGLTPLGDDILSGMITAGFRRNFPLKTNDISKQQIFHAEKRLVPLPVKIYLETGDDTLLKEMGVTSGLGWIFGIKYQLEGL